MENIEKRKSEHVDICLKEEVSGTHNYWNDINLIHNALPEINKNEINTETKFLDKKLSAPILIAPMSGGYEKGKIINENCAKAASELRIGFCVGSQRAALENPELIDSFSVVKDFDVPLVAANIGASQLVKQKNNPVSIEDLQKIMDMINADFLIIHLNYPQEMVQPEGNENAYAVLDAIEKIAENFSVIVKECGSGISKETAEKLKSAGVKAIDVSGVSGTSWTAVEYYRAKQDKLKEKIGKMFWDWGIPAPVSVLECKTIIPVISSGGIRNGLDVARSIILGADAASIARVLLPNALENSNSVKNKLNDIIEELKISMFLTGSKNIEQLKKVDFILTGKTKEWAEQRKLI